MNIKEVDFMTFEFIEHENSTVINVDFNDEGVNLQGTTTVKGDVQVANEYLSIFEKDLRNNFADKFPVVLIEVEEGDMFEV